MEDVSMRDCEVLTSFSSPGHRLFTRSLHPSLLSKTLRAFRALSRDLYKAEAGLTSLLPLIPDYLQRL